MSRKGTAPAGSCGGGACVVPQCLFSEDRSVNSSLELQKSPSILIRTQTCHVALQHLTNGTMSAPMAASGSLSQAHGRAERNHFLFCEHLFVRSCVNDKEMRLMPTPSATRSNQLVYHSRRELHL